MADEYNKEVIDTHTEHQKYHQSYHNDCSSCWSENLMIKASHEDMLNKYPALKNPYGSNYPTGYRPE